MVSYAPTAIENLLAVTHDEIFRLPKLREPLTYALLQISLADIVDTFNLYYRAMEFGDTHTTEATFELLTHMYYVFGKKHKLQSMMLDEFYKQYEDVLPSMKCAGNEIDANDYDPNEVKVELINHVISVSATQLVTSETPDPSTIKLIGECDDQPTNVYNRDGLTLVIHEDVTYTRVIFPSCHRYRTRFVYENARILDSGAGLHYYKLDNPAWIGILLYFSTGRLYGLVPGYLVVTRKHVTLVSLTTLSVRTWLLSCFNRMSECC